MKAAWAWILGNAALVIGVAVVAFLVLTRVGMCSDSQDSAENKRLTKEIANEKAGRHQDSLSQADSLRTLNDALANTSRVVDRWRVEKVPVYLPANSSPHDTIQSFAKRLNACVANNDSLVATAVKLETACTSYRNSTEKIVAGLREGSAKRDTLIDVLRHGKRVSLYFDPLYDITSKRPVFRIGNETRLLWGIKAKVEGEYQIPVADKTRGEGFRAYIGARVSF